MLNTFSNLKKLFVFHRRSDAPSGPDDCRQHERIRLGASWLV
ncbi:hypothetical protein B4113_3269 [Geobacillus sp. B4113_201601]|nr:hypothetical protein B4113_3269 [Geobacillus sp. B4113_201601]